MPAPLLHPSRPTLPGPNALAQSYCAKEPGNAGTNGGVLRAWTDRIRVVLFQALSLPERCRNEVRPTLNPRSSVGLIPRENDMKARPKGDARWQREDNKISSIRGWPKAKPSVLSSIIAWALTYANAG